MVRKKTGNQTLIIRRENMKLIGKINTYNGKFGTIVAENKEIIDFSFKDISLNSDVNIGDMVEFRLETKFQNIRIARNIKLMSTGEK